MFGIVTVSAFKLPDGDTDGGDLVNNTGATFSLGLIILETREKSKCKGETSLQCMKIKATFQKVVFHLKTTKKPNETTQLNQVVI